MEGDSAVHEGQILAGKFRLIELLGAGGMGAVWRAHHQTLDAEVAIKVLHPELARREQTLERFLREAKAAAKLRSPHVVQILDHGLDGGVAFIAMELLHGESLAQRLKRDGSLSPELSEQVMTHIGRAVTRAHQAGIVHRDLKPDNVFLVDNDGEIVAKVLDFGIAKRTIEELPEDDTASIETATGTLLGTPYYMCPEQLVSGAEVDHRADLWAMAAIAYECLTGSRPFTGATIGDVVLSVCSNPLPVPSRQASVPAGFDGWFARATEREPAARFQSAKAMVDDLSQVLGAATLVVGASPPGGDDTAADPHAATLAAARAAATESESAKPPAAPAAPAPTDGSWLVQKGDDKVITLPEAKLVKQLRKNNLSGLELARREGEEGWQPLYETALFKRTVPHRGDPKDAARWRLLRDFGAHLAIWLIICWVVTLPFSGGWSWWKWLWFVFVAIHGIKALPTAVTLWRDNKLLPWQRSKAPNSAEAEQAEQAEQATPEATPLERAIERLRELLGEQVGEAAEGLRQRLEQLARSARQLAAKEATIASQIAPERERELEQAEERARDRAAKASSELERELCNNELDAIRERRQAMAEARHALEPLRARRDVAAHQLEQLRLELASAEARALRLPDLSTRIDDIRIEAQAIQEVEQALAESLEERR